MSRGRLKASVRQARDRVVRALVRLGARRQLQQLREARQAALAARCRMARLRLLRQIATATASIDDDPVRLAFLGAYLHDKAEALWLIDEVLMGLEPIPCDAEHEDPMAIDS